MKIFPREWKMLIVNEFRSEEEEWEEEKVLLVYIEVTVGSRKLRQRKETTFLRARTYAC